VLDGAGDAAGEVDLRADGLAGLAYLVEGRLPARVDGSAGGADGAAEDVGEVFDEGEVFRLAEAAAAGDYGLCAIRSDRAPLSRPAMRCRFSIFLIQV
jgi:hypothetical protein